MGKRRNTAKTGDKAIYKGRPKHETRRRNDGDGDGDNNMYNEIDRFHNERDQDEYIRFDNENDGDDDDDKDLVGNKEAVLDLGVRGEESSSSDDEDDDDDDDSSSSEEKRHRKSSENMDGSDSNPSSSDSESDGESSDDDDDIKNLKDQLKAVSEDPRKWGKKKSLYYHGDTADLEIGQEEDDAFLEEEAAKEIQASRFEEMDEDDFVLSDDEEAADAKNAAKARTNTEKIEAARDVSKLSKKQARKLIQKQHPELLPMVSYFADVVKDLRDRTDVVTKALMEGEGTAESVGATIQGQRYLLTKALLQKSTALNAVVYLLLKSTSTVDDDGNDSIQAHPITDQLKALYLSMEKMKEKVEKKVPGLDEQLDTLVKAADIMNGGDASDAEDSESEDSSAQNTEEAGGQMRSADLIMDEDDGDEGDDYDDDEEIVNPSGIPVENQKNRQMTLNEARFGLRHDESMNSSSKASKKRNSSYVDDFGDLAEARSDVKMLANTINSIEQRSQVASRKRRPAPVAEELDDLHDHDDQLAEGIKMMEEELGKLDEGEEGDDVSGSAEGPDFQDPDAIDESLDFYKKMAKKSQSKKAFRKSLYEVAPKFPRGDALVDGERAISTAILKNRGLVAHKAKINRNPRVKKREQYRKALIRRKGAVREVREGESHKYGGEGTGIKSGISRSRKLTNK